MLKAHCHCGAVSIEIPRLPETMTLCDCSICRRYSTLWGYYQRSEIIIGAPPGGTVAYCWGEKSIEFVRCSTCGCVTHWQAISTARREENRMGVNMRHFEPSLLAGVRIRHLDGAVTEKYLD